MQFWKAWS